MAGRSCNSEEDCRGPIQVIFPSSDCTNNAIAVEEVLPSFLASATPGLCTTINATESYRWSCSYQQPIGLSTFSSPDCDLHGWKVPSKTEAFTTHRCFNFDTKWSYVYYCSYTSFLRYPPQPPQTIGQPSWGTALGAPDVPCSVRNPCQAGVPKRLFYSDPRCETTPLKTVALFENSLAYDSSCYTLYNSSISNIAFSVRLTCSMNDIGVQYYSNGCGKASAMVDPIHTVSYPLLDDCIYDSERKQYIKYMC